MQSILVLSSPSTSSQNIYQQDNALRQRETGTVEYWRIMSILTIFTLHSISRIINGFLRRGKRVLKCRDAHHGNIFACFWPRRTLKIRLEDGHDEERRQNIGLMARLTGCPKVKNHNLKIDLKSAMMKRWDKYWIDGRSHRMSRYISSKTGCPKVKNHKLKIDLKSAMMKSKDKYRIDGRSHRMSRFISSKTGCPAASRRKYWISCLPPSKDTLPPPW